MAEKPSSSLRRLEAAATRLNILTDETSEKIRALELMLGACSVGIRCRVLISSKSEEPTKRYLEYRPVSGRDYRIAITTVHPTLQGETKPWAECSRELKLESVKGLPDLINGLASAIEQKVNEAEQALGCLSDVLSQNSEGGSEDETF